MSQVIDLKQFTADNISRVDPLAQARLELAVQLMVSAQPKGKVDDPDAFLQTIMELKDALDTLADAIAWEARERGMSNFSLKVLMQKTCPTLAALYRAEALAGYRIGAELTEPARVAELHDLVKEAIEDRTKEPFRDNPIYPDRDARPSGAARWRKIAADVSGRE